MATKAAPKKLSSLNTLFTQASALRITAGEIKAQLNFVNEQQKEIEARILGAMLESGTEMHRVDEGSYSVRRATVPQVTDWGKLDAYILKTKSLDLLHRRLTATAWAARLEQGVEVPGVEAATVTTLAWRSAK